MHQLLKTALFSLGLLTAACSSHEQDPTPAAPTTTATASNDLTTYPAEGKNVVRISTPFLYSKPFLASSGGLAPDAGGGVDNRANEEAVRYLYLAILGRAGSSTDVTAWVNAYRNNPNGFYLVREAFATTTETRNNIAQFYRSFLGREANVTDINYWVGQLAQKESLRLIAQDILQSQEAAAKGYPGALDYGDPGALFGTRVTATAAGLQSVRVFLPR
ncbi:DUF4214 domain-containing protein [Hymenobacter terrenus]|uniref:DUF4214 domain-containing protein n=1 Tax=Hymenobacter terrenus TaxID=1629124 RepID=UPI0006190EBA|nr:DUF4214 domain-containing protein [Hymenobacter terrenus]